MTNTLSIDLPFQETEYPEILLPQHHQNNNTLIPPLPTLMTMGQQGEVGEEDLFGINNAMMDYGDDSM
jgi:hypothetical protein